MGPSPDKMFTPQLAKVFNNYCIAVANETGATGIRVEATFDFTKKEGNLKMKTFTTPDSKVERLLDPDKPMPRGAKLQHDVVHKVKSTISRIIKKIGG